MLLHEQRCVRHAEREAAARCPACGRFFCRECITEHDGRVLCSACLAEQAAGAAAVRQRRFRPFAWSMACAALLALWLVYMGIGKLLLRIPSDFHEGSFWQDIAGDS
jgi:hypothetical protein